MKTDEGRKNEEREKVMEKYRPGREAEPGNLPKRTVKDSVFRDLFGEPEYLLQLYKALHPEDQEVTKEELEIVTMKNILLDQLYNDLGFMVGNRLLVLIEAQSTWTVNIILRSLMYTVQTWHQYIKKTQQNVYGSKRIKLPRPELYVIYTGERKERKEWISLGEEFFEGEAIGIEVKVKMLYGEGKGDIISQYVSFTKIYKEQIKKYGNVREAILETIRICKDGNILREYLGGREKEVISMMMTLFDEEYALKIYIEDEKRKAAEEAREKARAETEVKMAKARAETEVKIAKAKAEAEEKARAETERKVAKAKAEAEAKARAETEMETKKETMRELFAMGLSPEKIAKVIKVNVEVVQQWLEKPLHESYENR